MKITIPTQNADHKVAQAALENDEITLVANSVHYRNKKVANYTTDDEGIHIEVVSKPFWVTEGMIRNKLIEVFQ